MITDTFAATGNGTPVVLSPGTRGLTIRGASPVGTVLLQQQHGTDIARTLTDSDWSTVATYTEFPQFVHITVTAQRRFRVQVSAYTSGTIVTELG